MPIVAIQAAVTCTEGSLICWMEAHPGMAAWAQLVGVFLSLIVAFAVALLPLQAEKRRRRTADRRAIGDVLDFLMHPGRELLLLGLAAKTPETGQAEEIATMVRHAAEELQPMASRITDDTAYVMVLAMRDALRQSAYYAPTRKMKSEAYSLKVLDQAMNKFMSNQQALLEHMRAKKQMPWAMAISWFAKFLTRRGKSRAS